LYLTELQVLIDHNTTAGFECIAEAREYLLKVGRKEVEDPEAANWPIRGSHAVAPVCCLVFGVIVIF
jgi:ribosomal protein RSM22 (predicted rRNA methylase)